jgi:DNA-binding CsgD family transcriptional regulator
MDILKHIGIIRRSGRYPWGSGGNSQQRSTDFLGYVEKLQSEGMSELEISKGLGITTSELRKRKSILKAEKRAEQSSQALKLKEKGMSNVAIGERMGLNESSVRALLDPIIQNRSNITVATANMLRDTIQQKGVIDVGAGVETHIGISRTKLNTAISLLEQEGYKVHYIQTEQLGTGKKTSIKVLAPPDVTYTEIAKNKANIKTITDYSDDGGRSTLGLEPINSISKDRVQIRYKEDGGSDKDGVIELRRGVDDISLGTSKYAQVRIGVGENQYMKGMAVHVDNLPKGVDIIYNTNKSKDAGSDAVFKKTKDDPDNPFGSTVRQKHFIDSKGKKQLSALNIVNEEGSWQDWSKSISSQVLSKQSPALAHKQLTLAKNLKQEEFDEIASLTNPVVKKRLLESFADDADSSAVHLKAAALPRQASHVILPITTIKENEIYAPNYLNGERVALIRHPHGGVFEIPELTVNNKNPEANNIMKNAKDAVGIHPNVAKKLSGADFDGDSVLVIPNKEGLIKTAPSIQGLKDFDTRESYPPFDGMKTIDGGTYRAATKSVDYEGKTPRGGPKQMQMGDVSNLITDMTIKGANVNEIARAVKHSMVVIDSEKHHLNYKQSAIDNGIAELKKKYQGGERAGASTLISRSSSELRVPERREGKLIGPISKKTGKPTRVFIDKKTGEKLFEETGEVFVNAKGKLVRKTTATTRGAEAKDALNLSSGTKMEAVYAQHANDLKALANKARKLASETKPLVYSPTAKQTYTNEVASLKAKLNIAYRNKPLERQAQLLANSIVSAKKQSNPHMEAADLKKIKGQALEEARTRTGAKKQKIEITDREWNAIQLGAVSNNTLTQILLNTDMDKLKTRATPRTNYVMTDAKIARAKSMSAAGYTAAEIASALGISTTSVQDTVG